MAVGAYQAYRKTQVETAGQLDLVIMLYDGAIKFAKLAAKMLRDGDLERAHDYLVRAQDIVGELMSSLNMDVGEIAAGLFNLYEYVDYCLVQANIKKDPDLIDQGLTVLTGLREAWIEIARKPRGGEDVVPS
ncbi:MAG: flagellar export chaperone FliS [Firmicutes bacterium]|jgi:flagellar protein FliS|nr:flagellar export chaperone FliS [Bacillota bacterium]